MPEETRPFTADHIFAAARADMEFGTNLTAARHHLENLLNAFSDAVCRRDAKDLNELMGAVAVSLAGQLQNNESKPIRIIDWFGHAADTVQTVSNLSLRFGEGTVLYSATYQDWDTEWLPRCTAIGRYTGRLKAGSQVWRWEEHRITRLSHLAGNRQPTPLGNAGRNNGQSHVQSVPAIPRGFASASVPAGGSWSGTR